MEIIWGSGEGKEVNWNPTFVEPKWLNWLQFLLETQRAWVQIPNKARTFSIEFFWQIARK
jgi:hypothetical protein